MRSDDDDEKEAPVEIGLIVDIENFEGPLDLLLHLVQEQKLDIAAISVLSVVDQFLQWMRTADNLKLELAADWIGMAATLALIKSRLLLPLRKEDQEKALNEVEEITLRLRRLDMIKKLAMEIASCPRLGQEWELVSGKKIQQVQKEKTMLNLHNMMKIYAEDTYKSMGGANTPVVKPFETYSVEDAIQFLIEQIKEKPKGVLSNYIHLDKDDSIYRRSKISSTFVGALELSKRGLLSIAQGADDLFPEIEVIIP